VLLELTRGSLFAFHVRLDFAPRRISRRLFIAARERRHAVRLRLMMQIGMIGGFATSLPMNWFLSRKGLKAAM
jgi:hypothetical protein